VNPAGLRGDPVRNAVRRPGRGWRDDRGGCARCSERPAAATAGFTLIEVLIAVLAFAIVLGAINTVFYSAMRLRNKTSDAVEKSLVLQQAVAIIKRDLAGIVVPGGILGGELKTTPDASSSAASPAAGNLALSSGPVIYTNTGMLDETLPWGDVQKVTYFLRNPTNRSESVLGKDLFRGVTRNVLATAVEVPTEQWLMGNVEKLQFYFYTGTEWRDMWDSENEETALPKAIKVQIQPARTQFDRSPRAPVEIVVPILIEGRTNQTQSAGDQA
jgi:type II secretion system protein J